MILVQIYESMIFFFGGKIDYFKKYQYHIFYWLKESI